jgi:hypothetical protein
MTDLIGTPIAPCSGDLSALGVGPYQKLYTWLSLDRYARIMGITPAHFWTAESDNVFPAPGGICNHLWWLYDWQANDAVARDSLTRTIYEAERQIAQLVGFPLAPEWISEEIVYYDKYHRPDYFGGYYDTQGRPKGLKAKWRRIIATGVRTVSLIATATVAGATITFCDLDSDGFNETFRITVPTTLTTTSEIKVYYNGYGGARGWEIRNPRKKIISGGNVIIDYYVWQVVKPEIYEQFLGTDPLSAVDMDNTGNFVTSVDVYREYTDTTAVSTQLYWEKLTGDTSCCLGTLNADDCAICGFTIQDGCLGIRDAMSGYVSPNPATYSATDGAWYKDSYALCRQPDFAKLWYQAGDLAPEYLNNESYDPLSHYWAQIIAWVTTARLERPPCECSNVATVYEDLSTDMAKSGDGNARYSISFEQVDNPLGTRKGEIMAYRRIKSLGFDISGVAF